MSAEQLRTFISYSREDQQFALRFAYELKSANFSIWMDQYDIPTGARWDDEIEKALRECEIFMFIMTPASVVSENAKDELGFAIDHGKHILPVLLEECEIPLRLSRLQYVDFTQKSFDEGIKSAKELLSDIVIEVKASAQENASHPSTQKEVHNTIDEPITAPSKRGAKSYLNQTDFKGTDRIKRRNKQISKWFFSTAVIIGIFTISALLLKPFNLVSSLFPTITATLEPTQTIVPTLSPVPTIISTTPPPIIIRSFTEEFEADTSWNKDWILQFRHGNPNKQKNFQSAFVDGNIVFDLTYEYVWGYFLYDASVIYKNVEIEAVVEDLKSTDTFALICQYSEKGWYEFDINGGGRYYVRYVDNMDSDVDVDKNIIKTGSIQGFHYSLEEPNENRIRVNCDGNNLSLYVNNTELLNEYPSDLVKLEQGQIGFAVRAYEFYPVHVVLKSISVHEP